MRFSDNVVTESSAVCLLYDEAINLETRCRNQGIATLFGKLGVQEDGGQES